MRIDAKCSEGGRISILFSYRSLIFSHVIKRSSSSSINNNSMKYNTFFSLIVISVNAFVLQTTRKVSNETRRTSFIYNQVHSHDRNFTLLLCVFAASFDTVRLFACKVQRSKSILLSTVLFSSLTMCNEMNVHFETLLAANKFNCTVSFNENWPWRINFAYQR